MKQDIYNKACGLSPDKCFPNRLEEIIILQHALTVNPEDFKALLSWEFLVCKAAI